MKRNEERKEENLKVEKLFFPVILVGFRGYFDMSKSFEFQVFNLVTRNKPGYLGDLDISQSIDQDSSTSCL